MQVLDYLHLSLLKNTATSNHAGWTLEKVKPGVNNNAFIKDILAGELQGGTGMFKIHLQFIINPCQLLSEVNGFQITCSGTLLYILKKNKQTNKHQKDLNNFISWVKVDNVFQIMWIARFIKINQSLTLRIKDFQNKTILQWKNKHTNNYLLRCITLSGLLKSIWEPLSQIEPFL